MEIEEQSGASAIIVSLNGRLDGTTAPDLEARVFGIVERGDVRVVLDCSELSYVSSSGLRVLLMCARKCQQASGKLALAALQAECLSVLEMSGFLRIIECHDTREAALSALS